MPLTQVQPGLLDTNAQYTGFKNRLINGVFEVWQRGNTSRTFASGAYSADRWCRAGYQYGAHERVSVASPVAGMTARYAMRVTSATTAEAAGGSRMDLTQKVESNNCFDLAGQTVTLSYWIRFSAATAVSSTATPYVSFTGRLQYNTSTTDSATSSDTGDGSVAYNSFVNGSLPTTWTKVATTATLPAGTKNVSARFQFDGLGNTTSAGSVWYEITEIQLEKGSTATSFDYRPYGTELALCQRYYNKSYSIDVTPGTNTSAGSWRSVSAGGAGWVNFDFPVEMRVAPTVTPYSNAGTSGVYGSDVGNWTPSATYISTRRHSASGPVTSGQFVYGQYVASSEL